MVNFTYVSLPVHRDKASAKVYDANGKYLFWITLAGESNALDALRDKGESWLDFRNRTQPMRDAIALEELSIADFMVKAINTFADKNAEIQRYRKALSEILGYDRNFYDNGRPGYEAIARDALNGASDA